MNKKLISLLIALCLVISLLPLMSFAADTPASAQIAIMSWSTMTAEEGGNPVYAKTVSYEGFTEAGVANGTGWKYTPTGASANDWNIKFEYPQGGQPTLTFKDATLDQIGDDGTTLYIPNGEGGYKSTAICSAVLPKSGSVIDLKIVLQGTNRIEANNGIVRGNTGSSVYFKSITIVGEAGSSLTGTGKAIGIQAMQGAPLTIENANINLTPVANSGGSAAPIYTDGGDLTIKNSTITATNTKNSCINVGGNIVIENSTINVTNTFSSSSGAGAINTSKAITINNSNINGESTNGAILTGKGGITINSGNLNLKTGYYAVQCGDALTTINGGNIEITAGSGAFFKAPVLGTGVTGVAGADSSATDAFDAETKYNAKYVKLSDGTVAPPPATETTAPSQTTAPTAAPSTAPSQTTAPSTVPSTTPSTQPTGPKTQIRLLSWTTMEAVEGGKIAYLKNEEYQGYDADGNATYKGWKMVAGSESDWNAKFEWPLGGTPTLTLKNAKLDMMGDDGKVLYIPDGEGGYKTQGSVSAIISVTNYKIDLKVVLEGENWVDVNNGIIRGATADSNYFKNITIAGTGKLSGTGRGIGISAKTGYDLIIDGPTLDLATTTAGGGTPIPIRTSKGNLTIKNANITVGNEKSMAIYAETSGDILIENSTIKVYSKLTGTSGAGAINAGGGNVTIINSTINAEGENNPGISSASGKITITGGNITVKTGYYAIYTKTGEVTINSGTLVLDATGGSGAFYKAPVLGAGVEGLAGPSEDNADFYDETKYGSKWVKLEGTGSSAPTNPSNPGGNTTAPSTPSGTTTPSAPSGTTPGGTVNPGTGDSSVTVFVVMMLVAMLGIVATVACTKKRAV